LSTDDGRGFFVRQSIRDGLIDQFGASPKEFIPITAKHNEAHLPWWMLWPEKVLPKVAVKESKIEIDKKITCDLCGRPGHYNTDVKEYRYNGDVWPRETLPAMMRSWEYYGGTALRPARDFPNREIATPRVVFRPDAASWLSAIAPRYCELQPITLIWKR
jgi:hypothetical protein